MCHRPAGFLWHFSGFVAALLALGVGAEVHASILGSQLVINGDAETGDTSGWSASASGIEVVSSAIAGTTGLPAGVNIGDYSFTGGFGVDPQTLSQVIDVSSLATQIDQGFISSVFEILLQSRQSGATDLAKSTVSFRDASNVVLHSQTFEDQDHPNNTFDWEQFAATNVLPTGTRNIAITLTATRSTGDSSDGFFDNVSLVLSSSEPVPEPSSLILFGSIGACGILSSSLLRRPRSAARRG